MMTYSELEDRLLQVLGQYPAIQQVFEQMLQKRLGKDDWLDNLLVQYLLLEDRRWCEETNDLMESIKGSNPELLSGIWRNLRGDDSDFDDKLVDVFVEMRAASWLIRENLTQVRKLPESSDKTPDFEAFQDGDRCVFEVKHLRPPKELDYHIDIKINSHSLMYPELYGNRELGFSVSPDDIHPDSVDENARLNVMRFLEKLEDALTGSMDNVKHSYDSLVDHKSVERVIECQIGKGNQKLIFPNYGLSRLMPPSESKEIDQLLKLLGRAWIKIEMAIPQLLAADAKVRCILLYWGQSRLFAIVPPLRDKFEKGIIHFNALVGDIDKSLSVRLM